MKRLINAGALADKLRTRKVMSGEKAVQDAYETAMWDALNEPEVTLNALRDEVYEDAVAHGLWEEHDAHVEAQKEYWSFCAEAGVKASRRNDCASRIICECIELKNAIDSDEEYAEELADVIIMSLSVAGKLGIDIDAAVKRKMEINKTRPWKHVEE
jgi:hypothetical protein